MRYIGNKEKLLPKIYEVIQSKKIGGTAIFDMFSGTSNVGRFFKKRGYQTFSSDLLFFSHVLQKAYLVNNDECNFSTLLNSLKFNSQKLFSSPLEWVVEYLNSIEPLEGFIYHNYTPEGTVNLEKPRMYYSSENGKIIDAIRTQIENWKKEKLISQNEYFILIACLIETVPFYANISGVYATFQKKWDPRAVKKLQLRPIELIIDKKKHYSYEKNSLDLLPEIKADIFYLDPPYNQRQYAPNYHLLETVARYDNPPIKGIGGLRPYTAQKSKFCNAKTAIQELDKIAQSGNYKTLILSYNSEGIMKKSDIISTLKKHGDVELIGFDYLRFKSNSKGVNKKYVQEQLYILRK